MKLAKDDGKEAYIMYNRLIVDGEVYTDGAYGKIPEKEFQGDGLSILAWNCNCLTEGKRSEVDFCTIPKENDIVFLLESWTYSKK